jgi:hypothetical protein
MENVAFLRLSSVIGKREGQTQASARNSTECGGPQCSDKPDKQGKVDAGFRLPFGSTVSVCHAAFSSDTKLACTIIHEFAHTCKVREDPSDQTAQQAFPSCY